MFGKTIEMKVGRMRKPQEFVLYPTTTSVDNIIVQSSKCIGSLNKVTREFRFTNKGSYFPDLSMHGVKTVLSDELKDEIIRLDEESIKKKIL